ncbi:acyl-CoA dehydrogenase [Actinoplanes sp. SE50]|uniref:acyl-CoA dehydrogenase family protein n=1 Tax=unclassified Actinoplanes TaxID=2626549 RepID=UPI00023ED604|nr:MULTISPECIES: acyl-CoA dehydrogenase family protein [unclassified Actinoplanes]AEV84485.1 Short-chain specific acyl-CoA dehydrogenase [Actinoplanes sp. SE50/110]ATO82877.1 acyl-CoA dehydrogenase [Actinoplanes sp. SE50]SLM00285.1 acyl-CoA dehydrogenase [Actinoplanes sp. SE50/110]
MTTTQVPVISPPRTAAEILDRAKALAPVLRERAAEIEKARTLPADVVELLRGTGVFRMCFGPEREGPGLTSMEQIQIIEALAYGDASAAWCAVIGANSGIYSRFLDPGVARGMFSSIDMVVAGLLQPSGRAERVPGGYRLSGRWSFGSGVNHSDWVMSGAFVFQDGEPYASPDGSNPHESRQFLVPRSDVQVLDNWDTTGLCGSGSSDYTMTDVYVPEEHTLTFDTVKGTPGPLAQPDSFTRTMCGVPLGVARAALDHAREISLRRTDRMTGTAWADSFRVQVTLAECEAEYNAARAGVYTAMTRQWEVLSAGGTLDDLTRWERAACPTSWVHAFRTSRRIVDRLYDLLQAWSINRSSPMDRWLRDTTTMCQHLIAQDRILQSAGAYLLDSRPEFGICLGIV